MTPEEAYRILEVEPGAAAEKVQEAYRHAALRTHPDRAEGRGLRDERDWLRVRDAYECLRAAGFPGPPPARTAAPPPPEPRRYRAPEWLERKWANERGESFLDHLDLDDAERTALLRALSWVALLAGFALFAYYAVHRLGKGWSPRPGVTIRWQPAK
ncbi:MAG: J domain-containing protein [Elusimicrobia bacterium]|nr:J domain-containing protein [Elusimicrobiota bacterium]